MRRTLLTVAAFLACAFGVGIAVDDLMPAPGTATSPTVEVIDLDDRPVEPSALASIAAGGGR